jgi:competence protein ComEC
VRHPAIPIALALLAGTCAGAFKAIPTDILAAECCLGLIVAALCVWQRQQAAGAVALVATAAICGCALAAVSTTRALQPELRTVLTGWRGHDAVSDGVADAVVLTGVLGEDVIPEDGGTRLLLKVSSVGADGQTRRCSGAVLLSVGGDAIHDAAGWWKGRTVRVPALLRRPARYLNPGVPDHEAALLRRGIALVGSVKSPLLIEVLHRGTWLDEGAARVRAWARAVIDREVGRHSVRSAAIVRAILIGDRTGLDDETEERMQAAGTYHVLAISGGNIAILAGLVLVVVRLLALRPPFREAVAIITLIAYAWLVGGGSSVTRATMMAVTMLAAHALSQRARTFNALAVAGGAGLVVNPLTIFDPGTWLTYGASCAIALASAATIRRLAARPLWVRVTAGLFVASLAAELALFPVSAFVFSRATAAGLIVNFAAIPLMTLVQVGGLCVLALVPFSAGAGGMAGWMTHSSAWALVESGRLVDAAPWLAKRLPAPDPWVMLAYYTGWVLLVAIWAMRPAGVLPGGMSWPTPAPLRVTRLAASALVTGAGLWMIWAPVPWWVPQPDGVRVTFIDVGQGDAVLVQCPNGQSLLVDAGGAGGGRFDVGGRVVAPVLWASGVRRLTYLVVTHGDGDHMNGAVRVVRDFAPNEVWEGVPVPTHPPLGKLRAAAHAAGATWRTVQRGDRVALGDVDVIVRHPPAADWERQRIRNDDSVTLEIQYRASSVVLPGDIEAGGEASVSADLPPAGLRVLQAPHHGSASSSSAGFIEAARPTVAVISAGRGNRYGHPHRAVIDRFASAGVPMFRTDRDGAITIDLDGRTIRVRTFEPARRP